LVIGAGPAGISCAHHLATQGHRVTVWDRNSRVGGLARTENFQGFRFDVGPHRFFTKNDMVDELWTEMAGEDLVEVDRLTRILYDGKLFRYPLKPFDALVGLGLGTSTKAVLSYMAAQFSQSTQQPAHFEEWVSNKFGAVLYEIFFKHYTEKVWGIPCSKISGDWATQRIRGLSLGSVILNSCLPFLNKSGNVKSLVDSFKYPKFGAGQTFERMAALTQVLDGTVCLNRTVTRLQCEGNRVVAVEATENGRSISEDVDFVFSSMPLATLVNKLHPSVPENIQNSARSLYYRDHLCVNLIIDKKVVFPDNWIYVHSPQMKCSRLTSYGNFSADMLGTPEMSAIAVEYFCFHYDDMWNADDTWLIKFAVDELESLGFITKNQVVDGYVCREPDSYPAYHLEYRGHVDSIREHLLKIENLSCIGRGGMYRYNNQDHAMLSGVLAARNYLGEDHDIWEVNVEDEYLEEKQLPTPVHAGQPGGNGRPNG